MDANEEVKAHLLTRLQRLRHELRFSLDGLDEYQVRRPMTPTGTNLLGLVKHVASVELGYFTEVFGREPGWELPWFADDADPDADLWVPASESRQSILDLHDHSARASDATITALPLNAPGEVPWWAPERRQVTLGQILIHVIAETARHAGHADIIREAIDGRAGQGPDDQNVTPQSAEMWRAHVARIEAEARAVAGR